jgi:radical SAM superfamily enzyme YgiQ (UPF0313 family)
LKLKIIYPKWPKMENQPEFHLPPHGPVCFAATIPRDIDISFCDEHVEAIDFGEKPDLVAISCMLTCQMPRGWEIADRFRAQGIPVLFGGIGTMLHSDETMAHADSVFLGEAEGHFERVIDDFRQGRLRKLYDKLHDFPDMSLIGPARRDVLNRELYNYRGIQMVDLIHASRGCRFNCFPCCTPYLGGRRFRPRDIDSVVAEIQGIDNDRFFFVDNSLAQDDEWEKELFRAIAPLKKRWISHPIKDDEEILDLAAEAGCWYVYQAIIDTSDVIRDRIRRLKDRGIGVEGTIILGTDDQDEDGIKRLVDYLMEIDLDLAEFTILTPFPHTPIRETLEREGRILSNDWLRYTGADTVFQPARMSVDKLNELHQYAWDTFYRDCSKEMKTAKLYLNVLRGNRNRGPAPKTEERRWGRSRQPREDGQKK